MKIGKIILSCLLLIGCGNDEFEANKKMRLDIDQLELSKTITEVHIDRSGNRTDTLSVQYVKVDENSKKRYSKKDYWYQKEKYSLVNYFDKNEDLFYREGFDKQGKSISIFQTITDNNGNIIKAIQINRERTPIDTTILNYSFSFHENGKVKIMTIETIDEEVGAFTSKVYYDEEENPIEEVMLKNKNLDTVTYQTWEYEEAILRKSIYLDFLRDTNKIIYHFENGTQLSLEEVFHLENGKFFKAIDNWYLYNSVNDRIGKDEKNQITGVTKNIKYIIEYENQ